MIFFPDIKAADGRVVTGTSVIDNFQAMGSAFSIAIILLTAVLPRHHP